MKIVALSDTHNQHRHVKVPDGDVLVHSGDISLWGHSVHMRDFNEWLGTLPHAHKIVISGNHDTYLQGGRNHTSLVRARELLSNATYLQDEEVIIDGVKFYGTPWQPWFGDWAFTLKRAVDRRLKWKKIPEDTDVLITHGPPFGILDDASPPDVEIPDHCGCEELTKFVEKIRPQIHIFGHIHISYGICKNEHTKFVNAALCNHEYKPVRKPLVIDLP